MISKTRSVFVQNGSILQRMQGSIWMNLKGFSADRETAENAGKSSDEKSQFVTFVLGGPGSGKGTQCVKIADVFGFTHLSAGDLLRKEISSNSEKGQMILDIIKEGKIVPSEVTVKLIQDAIRSSDSNKFLIDGFPRNEENCMAYESIIGMEPNLVLFFDCSTEEMIKRVLSRNQGRVDDNEETIKKRLKIFEDFNLPVINHYLKRGILHRISATGSEEDVFTRVRPIFEAYKALLSNRSNGSSTSTMELKISNFLQKCTFNQIKQIHAFIITTSLHQNVDVLSRFLRRSTEFGNMEYSDLVFSHILNGHFSNQVTLWNAMIRGYAFNGPFESGLLIYNEMQMRGLRPNNFTYPFVLHCCSRLRRFDLGNAVNCQG